MASPSSTPSRRSFTPHREPNRSSTNTPVVPSGEFLMFLFSTIVLNQLATVIVINRDEFLYQKTSVYIPVRSNSVHLVRSIRASSTRRIRAPWDHQPDASVAAAPFPVFDLPNISLFSNVRLQALIYFQFLCDQPNDQNSWKSESQSS